jgi:hypothetical protein
MGVAIADASLDGKFDMIVPNDKLVNSYFRNKGGGKFEEAGFEENVSLREDGVFISGMGVDFRDIDNDGYPDIVIVALDNETFPVYKNTGKGSFVEVTEPSGMAALSLPMAGYSPMIADFDNDGWKDIFTANSHVNDRADETSSDRYLLPNAVFRNRDGTSFEDATPSSPRLSSQAHAHRGCAVADFDVDGRLDVVVTALGVPPEIWQNTTPAAGHWIDIDLGGNPGASVRIGRQVNQHSSASGYSSSSFGPVHFGLGPDAKPVQVEVIWPDGRRRTYRDLEVDRRVRLR